MFNMHLTPTPHAMGSLGIEPSPFSFQENDNRKLAARMEATGFAPAQS